MTTTELVVNYEPRGAARDLFAERSPEVLLDGPAGTGKSTAVLYRLHLACLKYPGIRCLVVRKTAVSLGSTTLVTFEEKVAKEALAVGLLSWYGGSTKEAAAYRYTNGSKIVVGGMDKPEKIMSSEYDLAFVDEATELTIDDWEAISTRMRNGRLPWQQQIAACNPSYPTHWLKKRADDGTVRRLRSIYADNAYYQSVDGALTEAGRTYLARLDKLTGVRRLRLLEGLWAAAEGLIYEEWDDSIHMVDQFHIPDGWTRYWAIDFGFTNPFVCQWWAEDPDGRLYLYREIYRTQRTVDEHCAQIASLVMHDPTKPASSTLAQPWQGEWTEPQPAAIICDHDAEGRATLERELGLRTVAANKKVIDGIQAVKRRLRRADDGRPRLILCRNALVERDTELINSGRPCCTAEEIVSYIWQVKPGGAVQEVPRKEDDHGMDTARYIVAQRDLRPRYNIRSF